MSYLWAEVLCAITVGGGIGWIAAIIADWRHERDEMQAEINDLRERLHKVDPRRGWELISRD